MLMSFFKTETIPVLLHEGNSALNDLFNKLDSLSALAMQLFAFLTSDS